MKNYFLSAIFILIGLMSLHAQDKNSFNTYWDNGLKIESSDKNFKLKLGGRLQYDVMFIDQNDSLDSYFPNAYNGSELRRARFYMSGKIYTNISYKVQIDFAGSKIAVKDAWLNFGKIPVVGNLKVGKFKGPFGLNTLTSSKYITMMERPILSDYDVDRELGFMLHNNVLNKKLSWQFGFFFPSNGGNKYLGNAYKTVFRIAGQPIYKVEKDYTVLHIAGAITHQFHNNEQFSVSGRPEAHLAPKYLKYEIGNLKQLNAAGLEIAFIRNSFSIQSEYHSLLVVPANDRGNVGIEMPDPHTNFQSYYATISYFITGEHRNYSQSKTAFDKVKPKKNFGKDGWGAFELALRISHIEDDVHFVQGGEMNIATLGVNWYLNPATKFMFNYGYTDVPSYHGNSNIYQMRFQVAF